MSTPQTTDIARKQAERAFGELDQALGKRRRTTHPSRSRLQARPKAQPTKMRTCEVRSYENLPIGPRDEALMKLKLRVPPSAKPGETYIFRVDEKVNDMVVAGTTYIMHVRSRK